MNLSEPGEIPDVPAVSLRWRALLAVREAAGWARVIRSLPLVVPFRLASTRDVLWEDLRAWMAESERDGWVWSPHARPPRQQLLFLLGSQASFRSLFWYRVERGGRAPWLVALLLKPLYRGGKMLTLAADRIGPGCYLPHTYMTSVGWRSTVGCRARIYNNVSIGWDREGNAPTIGDDVTIYPGASVIGGITIGDGATIGHSTVVMRDVPPGATVFPAPARVLRAE